MTNISEKSILAQFSEKLDLFIRFVEIVSERNNLHIEEKGIDQHTLEIELSIFGFINSSVDISFLKKHLKKRYSYFIKCFEFYMSNKILFDKVLDKLNKEKRKKKQEEQKNSTKPIFVDFFSGAGGLSCGFCQAGYNVVFANDFEEVCVRTYRYNHPEIPEENVVQGDIRKLVDHIEDYIKDQNIDVVVGGPPCQGFSSANQQRIIDDPRNELYKYYIKAVSKILPKFVVMENVKGMLKVADQVVEDYKNIQGNKNGISCTYIADYKLLNSADFSVAQSRERLIYIAIRSDVAKKNNITPQKIFDEIDKGNKNKPHYVLNDALSFIPSLDAPRIKNMNEIDSEINGKKIASNPFCGNENQYLSLINDNKVIPFLFNHKARFVNKTNYEIYRLLNQGNDASDPKIAGIMPYKHRLHCFKDKYYKLIADRPSRTITAHLRMDCHSHIHPFQIRAITPREAARCQSFPDDYLFLGPYLKTYMQIGNAVPCLMARGIATVLKRYL